MSVVGFNGTPGDDGLPTYSIHTILEVLNAHGIKTSPQPELSKSLSGDQGRCFELYVYPPPKRLDEQFLLADQATYYLAKKDQPENRRVAILLEAKGEVSALVVELMDVNVDKNSRLATKLTTTPDLRARGAKLAEEKTLQPLLKRLYKVVSATLLSTNANTTAQNHYQQILTAAYGVSYDGELAHLTLGNEHSTIVLTQHLRNLLLEGNAYEVSNVHAVVQQHQAEVEQERQQQTKKELIARFAYLEKNAPKLYAKIIDQYLIIAKHANVVAQSGQDLAATNDLGQIFLDQDGVKVQTYLKPGFDLLSYINDQPPQIQSKLLADLQKPQQFLQALQQASQQSLLKMQGGFWQRCWRATKNTVNFLYQNTFAMLGTKALTVVARSPVGSYVKELLQSSAAGLVLIFSLGSTRLADKTYAAADRLLTTENLLPLLKPVGSVLGLSLNYFFGLYASLQFLVLNMLVKADQPKWQIDDRHATAIAKKRQLPITPINIFRLGNLIVGMGEVFYQGNYYPLIIAAGGVGGSLVLPLLLPLRQASPAAQTAHHFNSALLGDFAGRYLTGSWALTIAKLAAREDMVMMFKEFEAANSSACHDLEIDMPSDAQLFSAGVNYNNPVTFRWQSAHSFSHYLDCNIPLDERVLVSKHCAGAHPLRFY